MKYTAKDLNNKIAQLNNQPTLLDMLLEFEKVLDTLDLYAYQNWEDGEIAAGPDISRYWVTVQLMYYHDKMPDPRGARRLLDVGCMVKYKKGTYIYPVKIRSQADLEVVTNKAGEQQIKTRTKSRPIWLVTVQIPRKLVDETNNDSIILSTDDIVSVDNTDTEYGNEPENK